MLLSKAKFPYSLYFSVNTQLLYNSEDISSSPSPIPCIVDTGTTLIYIPKEAYDSYVHQTGSEFDKDTGLLRIPNSKVGNLKNFNIVVGKVYLD